MTRMKETLTSLVDQRYTLSEFSGKENTDPYYFYYLFNTKLYILRNKSFFNVIGNCVLIEKPKAAEAISPWEIGLISR